MKDSHMKLAIDLAIKAKELNEVPVGCIVTDQNENIISKAFNSVERHNDPTAHAEILAIRKACLKMKTTKLFNFSLYVTLEPCAMCEAAIINSGIKKVYFGAFSDSLKINNFKLKNYFSLKTRKEFMGGFNEECCSNLIKDFFKVKRKL